MVQELLTLFLLTNVGVAWEEGVCWAGLGWGGLGRCIGLNIPRGFFGCRSGVATAWPQPLTWCGHVTTT